MPGCMTHCAQPNPEPARPETMCGIVGIFDMRKMRDIDLQLLTRMNETQHHRGPTEGGVHREAGIGFGHRRLSIIDLSSGQQPLFNEDHSVVLVFNGEIYNFVALMDELTALGHTFRTRCDTEVIVHAWEEWGEACVQRFRGMFLFGSEREALMSIPGLSRELDPHAVEDYFAYGYVPEPRTIFKSAFKLQPGHMMTLNAGATTLPAQNQY